MRNIAEADLGFAKACNWDKDHAFAIRVCAWHHDAARARAEAMADGFAVTDTICPQCSERLLAKLMGEQDRSESLSDAAGNYDDTNANGR